MPFWTTTERLADVAGAWTAILGVKKVAPPNSSSKWFARAGSGSHDLRPVEDQDVGPGIWGRVQTIGVNRVHRKRNFHPIARLAVDVPGAG